MRYANTQKAETRARVVETAARVLRRDGVDGTGLVGLMGEAGLTKGGFYAHFESKDDLVAEAVTTSLGKSAAGMRAVGDAATDDGLSRLYAITDAYLSLRHAATPEGGCTVGALLSDLTRTSDPIRTAAASGAAGLVAVIEAALPVSVVAGRRARAQAILGTMVGNLQLARLEIDPGARNSILAAARDAVRRLAESTNIEAE